MATNPERLWMSPENYLMLDRASHEMRYEYIDGYAYVRLSDTPFHAMDGGSLAHSALAVNMVTALVSALGRQGPCRVYNSDARVQLSEERYVYSDLTVSCDISDRDDIIHTPRIVVEILSPGTETYDRIEKLAFYRACASIQEIILVSTKRQALEVYRREQDEKWLLQDYDGMGQRIELCSIDVQITMEELYEGVRLAK